MNAELKMLDEPCADPHGLRFAELVGGEIANVANSWPGLGVDAFRVEAADVARRELLVGELADATFFLGLCILVLVPLGDAAVVFSGLWLGVVDRRLLRVGADDCW